MVFIIPFAAYKTAMISNKTTTRCIEILAVNFFHDVSVKTPLKFSLFLF